MLNEVGLPHAVLSGVLQYPTHYVQLVIAWEIEGAFAQRVRRLSIEADEMLQDVAEAFRSEHFFPKVSRAVSVLIYRIAGAVVFVSLVERQKEGALAR